MQYTKLTKHTKQYTKLTKLLQYEVYILLLPSRNPPPLSLSFIHICVMITVTLQLKVASYSLSG